MRIGNKFECPYSNSRIFSFVLIDLLLFLPLFVSAIIRVPKKYIVNFVKFTSLDLPDIAYLAMARVCQVTGKRTIVGNNVSHANNKTKRRFLPNLQRRRLWVEGEGRFVSIRLSNAGLRTIDKNGIEAVLFEMRARGEKI